MRDEHFSPSRKRISPSQIEAEHGRYGQSIKDIRDEINVMQHHRRGLEEKLEMLVIKENEEFK